MPETIEPGVVPSEKHLKRMFDYHRRVADQYAVRSHETPNHGEISDGYSALSEAHNQFAMACGRLAGVDLSEYEGEM